MLCCSTVLLVSLSLVWLLWLQVTSWIAVVIMLAITIVTVTRLLLLIARRGAVDREMVTMVKYDKLQDVDIND